MEPMDPKALLERNEQWAARVAEAHPGFFDDLKKQQSPRFLWIGCSDSRVPANEIVGLPPGAVFVHRNVANIVVYTDFSCLSVLQYAVDVLKVAHVIVCGHYGCGGVHAALCDLRVGAIDNWLRHVQDVRDKHAELLAGLDEEAQSRRLCELNVIEQVENVARSTVVQDAWARGQDVTLHGWIYGLADGRLHDLKATMTSADEIALMHRSAIERLTAPG